MVRHLSVWLFGATVICGCAEPAKTVPETTAAATNHSDEASGEPGGAKGGDSASTTTTSLADGKKPDGDVTSRPEPLLSQSQLADGWVQLFDGQTLCGWKANSQANWSVRAGAIHADTGPPGLLVTTVPFADYELTCDSGWPLEATAGCFCGLR